MSEMVLVLWAICYLLTYGVFCLFVFKVSTQRRPSIPESGSKVPFETRQRYIGLFLAECFKMCGTVNEAIDKVCDVL